MKLICPDCGRQYGSGRFCTECGAKLEEVSPELVCPSCGYKAKSGKFCPECGTRLTERIPGSSTTVSDENIKHTSNDEAPAAFQSNGRCSLPMDEIRKAAEASYPKQTLKDIAIAAFKIAEVIQERIPEADVSYLVYPSDIDSSVDSDALPIHFLFKKNGIPAVAVVAVTTNGYKTPRVQKTEEWCRRKGIKYVRVYANGPYSDWIQGWSEFTGKPVTAESVEFCKNWLVGEITSVPTSLRLKNSVAFFAGKINKRL